MIFNNYKKIRLFCLLLFASVFWQQQAQAQANIKVRVLSIEAVNNVDCDGFLSGDSDFVWEYKATDNTIGRVNNNAAAFGLLGDFNYAYRNGDNGPYVSNAPGGDFSPSTGLFFDYDYVCPLDVPSAIRIDWRAYENDEPLNYSLLGLLTDGETANQVGFIPVPGATGSSINTVYAAPSTDAGCAQLYRITFRVDRLDITVNSIPDNVCDAQLLPVNGNIQRFAWCPDATLEIGEPNRGEVSQNRSRWFYFIAPASGRVDISTDHGGTEFDTYFEVYHAADGAGCTAGLNPSTFALIKRKFEYLSYVDFADAGGFANLSGQADITFNSCNGLLSSNALVAGEAYYIQITTDDPNQRGYIEISISNLGGSPAQPEDIACRGRDVTGTAQNTVVRTFAAGSPTSATLNFDCATDRETGDAYFGNDPEQFQAYDYNHNATNNGTIHESEWVSFIAPLSGRIYFEGDVRGAFNLNESENTAFFGLDSRFQPNVPLGYSCANLNFLKAAEGGTGLLGANPTAIITEECLEPGYRYYGMIDPSGAATGSTINTWLYDPSVIDPQNNPPGNDILCLSLTNPTFYEVPVIPADSTLPFAAVAGSNVRACREYLAGEPASNPNPALRADQTVWHYFTVPNSGVVDINLRAYIGMNTLNYAIYPLLNGSDCYGGLRPATYTQNGTPLTPAVQPIAQGSTNFNGTTVSLCCLPPAARYAIQIDGGAPGDQGQYIIEFIREVKVYAGDSQYSTEDQDTITYNSADTAYICYGDTIAPSVMLNGLGLTSTRIPQCMDVGFVLHSVNPIPNVLIGSGFTYIDSMQFGPYFFVNNGNGSGSFGNPAFNSVYYVSALADEAASWGRITCGSASIENGAPVVFLQPIVPIQSYNQVNCSFTFSATGGLPAYNSLDSFNFAIIDPLGDTVQTGRLANGQSWTYFIAIAGVYNIVMTDGVACSTILTINAAPCLDPCVNNPVRITPSPLNSSIYSCLPNNAANVTLQLNGGAPSLAGATTGYSVTVSGYSIGGQNGVFTQNAAGVGTVTPFVFQVNDGDAWMIIVADANGCRDTAMGTFIYNVNNCPNYCSQNPITTVSSYNCLPNGAAIVEVTVGGGAPAINGSNYFVSVAGSTILGQTFSNAQIAGNIGSTVVFSFLVNDGDAWTVTVNDTIVCRDTLAGTYVFNVTNCPDLCDLLPVTIIPDPINNAVYACNGDGTATVTINILGGDPAINNTNFNIRVLGSSVAGQNGTYSRGVGAFSFTVADGDTWSVIAADTNTCADTATGTFIFNLATCPTICSFLNLEVFNPTYFCNPDGTALVTVTIRGGKAGYNGSNYSITTTGSSVGGNASGVQVAGVVGGSVTYQFLVNDGDTWSVAVRDTENCEDILAGTFVWNISNCGNICNSANYNPITINNGNGFTYDCDGNGSATVDFDLAGGLSNFTGNIGGYTAIVTINGVSSPYPISTDSFRAYFAINLQNGDEWSIQVFDAAGCDTATISSTIFNAVNAVATTDATYELLVGQFANLFGASSTGAGLSYQWTPIAQLGTPTTANTTVQPLQTEVYTLVVRDTLGCVDTATVEVPVGLCVPLHAGFTPNADGTNDTWQIPCLLLFDNEVEVYNRWGQQVFSAVNYDGTWDGTSSNQDLPAATYYYVIRVFYPNEPEPVLYKGTVSILR